MLEMTFTRIALLSLDPGSDDQTIINLASGLTEDLSTSLTSPSKKLTVVTLNEAQPTQKIYIQKLMQDI